MRVRLFEIAALICAVFAFLAPISLIFGFLTLPLVFSSLILASFAAFTGGRWFAISALLLCLFILFGDSSHNPPGYSLFNIHREGDTGLRTLIVIAYLGPIAGLFFRAIKAKKKFTSFIPASLALLIVLATLQTLDVLQVGVDLGWKHEVTETSLAPVPQEPCFSQPNALCVLNLAVNGGLPTFDRMLILNKLSLELKAADTTVAREMRTEVLKAAEHALNQAEYNYLPGGPLRV